MTFDQVYTPENRRVVQGVCFGILRDPADVEDAEQDVFLRVSKSLAKFRGESKVSTWLHTIASKRSLEILRIRQRAKRNAQTLSIDADVAVGVDKGQSFLPEVLPGKDIPADRMVILNEAIGLLRTEQRAALLLHCDGLTDKEIGSLLGVSISCAKSILHRARLNLRSMFKTQ